MKLCYRFGEENTKASPPQELFQLQGVEFVDTKL
jgi:hypothetical protein